MKTVWVLGAGFSKPLGGPLLPRLLSAASFNNLQSRFPGAANQILMSQASRLAVRLYGYGTNFKNGRLAGDERITGEDRWDDAEEFLDFLATADEGGETCADAQRIRDMFDAFHTTGGLPSITELNAAARRLVAAECSVFLLDANMKRESWEPYIRWKSQLSYDDTIVTFNYDMVPDMLGMRPFVIGEDNPHEKFKIPRVLKMHGSVNWESTPTAAAAFDLSSIKTIGPLL